MLKRTVFILSLFAGAFSGCAQDETQRGETIPAVVATTTDRRPASPAPPARTTITNLKAPESVLHDPDQDVYFISNINGGLLDADNNGFITRVDAETLAVDMQWIAGGKNGVTLHAPKGMAIAGETLYVSDIDGVRKFDRRSGAPTGVVALPGATLINDLATDGQVVWVSDTGLKLSTGTDFARTGTDAIWEISGDRARKIAGGESLRHPNGLAVVDGKLWAVSFGSNELYRVDSGTKAEVTKLPKGQLDGIVHLADGSFVISSWEGDAIYRGTPGGDFSIVLQAIDTPADLGYDAKRHLLLVPRSTTGEVTMHPLQ